MTIEIFPLFLNVTFILSIKKLSLKAMPPTPTTSTTSSLGLNLVIPCGVPMAIDVLLKRSHG